MKLSQVILKIEDSASSLFTKEDVLKIVNLIDEESDDSSSCKTSCTRLSEDEISDIAARIAERIENDINDWTELDNITISAGSYGGGIDDSSFTVDTSSLASAVEDAIADYFEDNCNKEDCQC